MNTLSPDEGKLIVEFLNEFKKMVRKRLNIPFNPRSLTLISQPDLENPTRFDYVTYNKWFDEMEIQADVSTCNNILEACLEVPIQILIDAEKSGHPLVSKKDKNRILKALTLLSEIKVEKQK